MLDPDEIRAALAETPASTALFDQVRATGQTMIGTARHGLEHALAGNDAEMVAHALAIAQFWDTLDERMQGCVVEWLVSTLAGLERHLYVEHGCKGLEQERPAS